VDSGRGSAIPGGGGGDGEEKEGGELEDHSVKVFESHTRAKRSHIPVPPQPQGVADPASRSDAGFEGFGEEDGYGERVSLVFKRTWALETQLSASET